MDGLQLDGCEPGAQKARLEGARVDGVVDVVFMKHGHPWVRHAVEDGEDAAGLEDSGDFGEQLVLARGWDMVDHRE